MIDPVKDADAAAPMLPGEPLPARVSTLKHIPAAMQPQYRKTLAGDFQLYYLDETDQANRAHHLAAIADGRIIVTRDGQSPEQIEAADAEARAAADAETQRILAQADADAAAKRLADAKARIERETGRQAARLEAAREEQRQLEGRVRAARADADA